MTWPIRQWHFIASKYRVFRSFDLIERMPKTRFFLLLLLQRRRPIWKWSEKMTRLRLVFLFSSSSSSHSFSRFGREREWDSIRTKLCSFGACNFDSTSIWSIYLDEINETNLNSFRWLNLLATEMYHIFAMCDVCGTRMKQGFTVRRC